MHSHVKRETRSTLRARAPCAQALAAGKTAQLRRVYYDFADMLRTNPSGNVPYTPSLPLLYGLQVRTPCVPRAAARPPPLHPST